jgi:hypothetical protein
VTVLVVLAVWWTLLAGYVLIKARRPKWEYPRPPKHARPADQVAWPHAA